MKIALAQIKPRKGDVVANTQLHMDWIRRAVDSRADAIFFPELSLTGYEPELAKELALQPDDKRLDVFQQLCENHRLTIGVGVPTRADEGVRISMIVFQPGNARRTYSKQHLHADEVPYFACGDDQLIITVGVHRIAPAICYESLLPQHAEAAAQRGATVYLASVAKPQRGIDKAFLHYPETSRKHRVPVLMVNCVGPCDNFVAAGQTAAWDEEGELVRRLDARTEGLLVLEQRKREQTNEKH